MSDKDLIDTSDIPVPRFPTKEEALEKANRELAVLISTMPVSRICSLIAQGHTERHACKLCNVSMLDFFLVVSKDEDSGAELDTARKKRADIWADAIVSNTVDQDVLAETGIVVTKEIPEGKIGQEKLNFEKLKYLASIDNPDKYGNRVKSVSETYTHNVLEIKGLSSKEALSILRNDPFLPKDVIDVTPVEVVEEEEDIDHGLDYL